MSISGSSVSMQSSGASSRGQSQSPMPMEPSGSRSVSQSPRHMDPTSPRHMEPTSPRRMEPTSPRRKDPTSPRHMMDPSSPRHKMDPSSPRHMDPSSPRHMDPSSPRHMDPYSSRSASQSPTRPLDHLSARSVSQSPVRAMDPLAVPDLCPDVAAQGDWKARYHTLEAHYKEQIPKIREAMARMVSDLERKYHECSQRAKLAEARARELEQSPPTTNGGRSTPADHQVEALERACREKDREIAGLRVEVDEQRKLQKKQEHQIKEKTTAIREYVSKKVRDLETQNTAYRLENATLREMTETLRQRLQALPTSAARELHRISQTSGDLRMSTFSEDSFCPPVPKRPSESILATIRSEQDTQHGSPSKAKLAPQAGIAGPMDSEETDMSDEGVTEDLGGDYQEIDDNHESKYEPRSRFGPPQVRIERKVFPKHGRDHPNTTSVVSSVGGSTELLKADLSPLVPDLPSVPPNSPSPLGPYSTSTVSALATLPRHPKATKMFSYSPPPREYTTQTIDRRLPNKDGFDRSQSERCRPRPKPPTPPIRRLPPWENRIYAIANIGLRQPEAGNISNRVSSLPVTDSLYSEKMYEAPSVPVYTTVKGRAAQIRSMPFSGESSSDSSDNEDASDATMATGGSKFTTGGSGLTPHSSPSKSASQGTPRATKRAVSSQSIASETSSDYAVPPDDDVSIQTDSSDNSEPENKLLRYTTEGLKKDGMERCGYLTKLGGKVKSWKRRWFVLKNGELLYYKSHLDMSHKPQGHISLDQHTRISRSHSSLTFEITTVEKTYYLTADNSDDMDQWIKVLQNVTKSQAAERSQGQVRSKEVMKGWLIKTRNGRSRRCWCVLLGKFFMYYRSPEDKSPLGQILLRDARVEEVDRSCDSESDSDDTSIPDYTLAIWPVTHGPTYLMIPTKHEKDSWLYHLTVASGGGSGKIGTEYEQLISKLMESDQDSAYWKHLSLLHTKDPLPAPLTTLSSETLQLQALELFRCVHSFTNVAIESPQLDQHVSLAQTVMASCLTHAELQNELYCQLIKQTSPHPPQHRSHMQNFLLCGSSSWFLCDAASPTSPTAGGGAPGDGGGEESKLNPAGYVMLQGWQLLAAAIYLFLPKQRVLWYLKAHLARHADNRTESGKYAIFCQRALERTLQNGGRESRPSRMEVLSILLRNPYHHSQPISIPVHFLNGLYQVVSFDGSTTVQEFLTSLNKGLGMRECTLSGFALFTDDPAGQELEHCLKNHLKICDVISDWEKAFLYYASQHGRADTSRTVKLTYKSRMYFKSLLRSETEKERLLLTYQINDEIVSGRFPLNRDLAVELAALMAQVEFGDYRHPGESIASTLGRDRGGNNTLGRGGASDKPPDPSHLQLPHVVEKFYPRRYKDLSPQDWRLVEHIIKEKWIALHGRTTADCVRIYLTVARGWQFFGAKLLSAKLKRGESSTMQVWLAVQEEGLSVLDFTSLRALKTYEYKHIVTFGGHRDDFMIVVQVPGQSEAGGAGSGHPEPGTRTCRLLFAISQAKVYEVTMLMASYVNSRSQHRTHQRHLQHLSSQSQASRAALQQLSSQSQASRAELHLSSQSQGLRAESSGGEGRDSRRDTTGSGGGAMALRLLPNKPCKPLIPAGIQV